jgi:Cof subfamily protein (haloacid dehalogenase superfamily)
MAGVGVEGALGGSSIVGGHAHPALSARPREPFELMISDIDNTLLPHGENKIPVGVGQSFQRLQKSGVQVALATGRSYREAVMFADQMGLKTDKMPFVVLGGAQTFVPGSQGHELLKRFTIPPDKATALIHQVRSQHPEMQCLVFQGKQVYSDAPSQFKFPLLHEPVTHVPSLTDWLRQTSADKAPEKVMFHHADRTLLKPLVKDLTARYHDLLAKSSCPDYLEVINGATSKGHAIEALASHRGLSLKRAVGIGDNYNDVEMMTTLHKHGGLAVAVANATDQLKSLVHWVTGHVKDEGARQVADAVLVHNQKITPLDKIA